MSKTCYVCREVFGPMSLKTSRSRFKIMGLPAPEGMGEADRVCVKCIKKIHAEQMKKIRLEQFKRRIIS